ncbi:MAG: AAA family ATPase [Bacteroidales bacterium]|nr:AAA family ATPase [Bacteroidales bacterium]
MTETFIKHFYEALAHDPTNDQTRMIHQLGEFVLSSDPNQVFLLKGYAGTGKTTLVSALINILPRVKMRSLLLAPTGRAAKVLAGYSGKPAYTIHKKIYRLYTRKDGSMKISLNKNMHKDTIFFVDEASMIPDRSTDSKGFAQHSLLDDLVEYIYSGQNCKMILIGDAAQLPPVGLSISPALDTEFLKSSYSLDLFSDELTEVVRQEQDSGILVNATQLREKIAVEDFDYPFFRTHQLPQVNRITGNELEEALLDTFNGRETEESVVITRSNKRANLYNREIRRRILFQYDELSSGDYMMVVKNNYFWLPGESKAGFIANGDIIEILKVKGIEEMYGFRFASVSVRLVDYPEEDDLDVMLLLDTIDAESASLTYEQNQKLFQAVMEDYTDIAGKRKRLEKVKSNPYFNALQVKFAYSLTCHKTQGGQWDNVFVEQGFFRDEMLSVDYLRWLYTALTRATKQLYLVNFKQEFFEEEEGVYYYD